MNSYKIFEENLDDDCGQFVTYGIAHFENDVQTHCLCDISTQKEDIEALVRLFNEYELMPAHFSQAVEEYLYDQCVT